MQTPQIQSEADLEAALEAPDFWLLKHSKICPVSLKARGEYRAFLELHPGLSSGWIDVIASRALSASLAQRTGIQHESPQVLRFSAGRVVWHASHGSIRADALEAALRTGEPG